MSKRPVTRLSGLEIYPSTTNKNTGLFLDPITTTQRNAIQSPTNGLLVFNGDVKSYQGCIDGTYNNLSVQGGTSILKYTATAANYQALVTDCIIGVTNTAAVRTITLPAVATTAPGQIITVKDESGAANTNNIIVDGNAAETIDGAANKAITANYGSVRVYSTGTAWFTC